jgi:hypothetical protein
MLLTYYHEQRRKDSATEASQEPHIRNSWK